jgi:protein SCO1/2
MRPLLVLVTALTSLAADKHAAQGIVLKTDSKHNLLVVSCEAVPGYMDAMEMEFRVREPRALAGLKPGSGVKFTIVARGSKLYAEDVHENSTANFESEPMQAGELSALANMLNPAAKALSVGERVPDFGLTDQTGKTIHLADFEGKVVALTFGYSRCPNPNYCLRLSNNLARVAQRLHSGDLILITIMIDPEHDRGETLTQYAAVWKADPASWHFLTGPLAEIKQVAALFGMNFWSAEGLLTHTLHTAVIDRKGQLAVNLEGNQFSAQELGDLVRTVMERPN